jgi:hypothetical protein
MDVNKTHVSVLSTNKILICIMYVSVHTDLRVRTSNMHCVWYIPLQLHNFFIRIQLQI